MIKNLLSLLITIVVINFPIFSQNNTDNIQMKRTDESTQEVNYIKFRDVVDIPNKSHNIWLKETLKSGSNSDFKLIRSITDNIGQTHYRYQEMYNGYPVEGYQYIIHTNINGIISINGDFKRIDTISNSISISKNNAISLAKKEIPSENYMDGVDNPIMVIHDSKYTWKVDVYSLEPLDRSYIFVDAGDGSILQKINRIQHTSTGGTAHTMYQGFRPITVDSISPTLFNLIDNTRNITTFDLNKGVSYNNAVNFTDTDNYWDDSTNFDRAAFDAHWSAEKTYDFYYNNYGLNSYNGNGASINSYVHYATSYNNAFWNGSAMTYGDGDGYTYTPLTSLIIVAHEITHAVTQNSANLIYYAESGALNESFSDIFGVTVDFINAPLTANWFVGDEIQINGTGFRDMSNPKSKFNPDTYHGTYWVYTNWDNGGVHYNSGVQNYWYYLLVNGGNGVNDNSDQYVVNGIGLSDAADIAFRNLTVYLTPNSQYTDARFYGIQSAIDLFGSCSPQVVATTNAWYAVGVGNSFTGYASSSFHTTILTTCTYPTAVPFVNTSVNDSARLWDFGDGTTDTTFSPTHIYSNPGVYDVRLITYSNSACGLISDTLIKNAYILIDSVFTISPANCVPSNPPYGDAFHGVFGVWLSNMSNITQGAIDGYMDYSCSKRAYLDGTDTLRINVGVYSANLSVYIDWNDDGSFTQPNELVLNAVGSNYIQINGLTPPANAVKNTPLRMRVIAGTTFFQPVGICGNNNYYQTEDYSVVVPECGVVISSVQSGVWNDGNTWCDNIIPTITDSVLISPSHTIIINNTSECSYLSVSPYSQLNIENSLIIDNAITNNGIVNVFNNASLIQNVSTDTNSGLGVYNIYRLGDSNTLSYNIWSSPIKNSEFQVVYPTTNQLDIWKFNGQTQQWEYDSDGFMDIATGYFIPGDGTFFEKVFTGQINNGTYLVPIYTTTTIGNSPYWDDNDWNLIGNPYPSRISVADLYSENINIIADGIYWWDNGVAPYAQYGDYAVYNSTGGVPSNNSNIIPNGFISSGQGVFIATDTLIGNNDSVYLEFNNSMRYNGDNSQFYKKDIIKNQAWITISDITFSSTILLGTTHESTNGIDILYDAHSMRDNGTLSLRSIIENEEFVIQGFSEPLKNNSETIPLIVNTVTSGIYTFSIDSVNNFNNYEIFIHDSILNINHRLDLSDYSVKLGSGEHLRFSIEFKNMKKVIKEKPISVNVDVTTDIEMIYVTSDSIVEITIFDILGRVMYNESGNQLNINTSKWNSGIYIISYISSDDKVTNKLIIK